VSSTAWYHSRRAPRSRFKAGLLTVLVLILAIVAPISYLELAPDGARRARELAVRRFIGHTPRSR